MPLPVAAFVISTVVSVCDATLALSGMSVPFADIFVPAAIHDLSGLI
jgi:hypothetical protein